MGGFAGGDEGGYWDSDTTSNDTGYSTKAHPKVTVFLKITGYKDRHPALLSRVVRVEKSYDTISFVPAKCETFTIEGCDDIPIESNTIYRAYKALHDFTGDSDILDFFHEHKVVMTKRIALTAGFREGASNAAEAFIRLVKEVCSLTLSTDELIKIDCYLQNISKEPLS